MLEKPTGLVVCPLCLTVVSFNFGGHLSASECAQLLRKHGKYCAVLRKNKIRYAGPPRIWACPGCGCGIDEDHKATCTAYYRAGMHREADESGTKRILVTTAAGAIQALKDIAFGVKTPEDFSVVEGTGADPVEHPAHYTAFPLEVIDIIKRALGLEGFKAYCFGSEIKYRMRAGLKGNNKAAEDISKALAYKKFREEAE